MQQELIERLTHLVRRREEIGRELSEPEVAADADRLAKLSREYARLGPLAEAVTRWHELERELEDAQQMARDEDPQIRELAQQERERLLAEREELSERLREFLLPRDPLDDCNVFLEIRAGTGGDEAALFAGDLFRMYSRYAETRGWTVEIVSASPGEHGGYREIICRIDGDGAWSALKFESGVHRVQRVPQTESQGRIHTSAATVAVLPEVPESEEVAIDPSELRIDTYRASGAGGQHVNKTDSAVRITHLPTGIVVECQDERSQHKNRARAMALLRARLLDAERRRRAEQRAQERRAQVGSGDRSERIRTYNFPQGRVTDHRINLTLYQLDRILDGELDELIRPIAAQVRARQLAEMQAQ